ncbi:MAG: translocation/assembly module TamB domain-containing protein [Planctomycetes bacterium]|nr:translocation/assembly module TamB domain-containing protein [Planctomycetota bacterium]
MKPRRPDPWRLVPRPGRLRRAIREIVLLLVPALLCAVTAVHGLRRSLFEARLKQAIVEILRDRAGIEAEIGTLEGTWLTTFVLTDAVLRGGPGRPELSEARIDRAEARFDLPALARGDLRGIRELRLRGARVSLDLAAKPAPSPAAGGAPAAAPAAPAVPGGEPGAPSPSRPFHDVFVPPLHVEVLDLELRGAGFSASVAGAGLDTAGTVSGVTEGVAGCDGWRLEVRGRSLAGGTGFLRFRKTGARLLVAAIDGDGARPLQGEVRLPDSLAEGNLEASVRGDAPPLGRFRAEGSFRLPRGEEFRLEGECREADLAGLAEVLKGLPVEPHGRAELDFRVEGEALDPLRLQGFAKVRLADGGWRGGPEVEGLDAGLELRRGLEADVTAQARWRGGEARVSARGGPGLACALTARVQAADLGPLWGGLAGRTAELSVAAEGRMTDEWRRPGFRGNLRLQGPDALGVRDVLLEAAGSVDPERFDLTRLRAVCAGGAFLASARGLLPPGRELDGKISIRAGDVSLLVPAWLAAKVPVRGALQGSGKASVRPDGWSASGDLRADEPAWGTFDADVVQAAFQAAPGSLEVYDLRVTREESALEVPYFEVAAKDGALRGRLPHVQIAVGDEALTSSGPLEFSLGERSFRLTGVDLKGDWARISASGEWSEDGRVGGSLAAEGVQVDRVVRLFGLKTEAEGTVALKVALEGTAEDPRLEGGVLASDLRIGDFPPADVIAGLRFGGGRFEVLDGEIVSEAGRAAFRATAPLPIGAGRRADAARILEALCTSPELEGEATVRDLKPERFPWKGPAPSGLLSARARVRGPLTAPEIEAAAAAERVSWRGFSAPRLSAALRSEKGGIRLAAGECRAETELGWAEVEGWVPLRLQALRAGDGSWAFDPFPSGSSFDVTARTGAVDVRALLERVGAPERFRKIEGAATLREARVGGTWESPSIEASGRVERIWSEGFAKPGKASFEVEVRSGRAAHRSFEAELAGGWAEAEGRIPLRLDLDALRGKAPVLDDRAALEGEWEVRGIGIGCATPFIPGIERLAGRLDARGSVAGPWRDPDLEAEARVSGGALILQNPDLPKLGSAQARLVLEDRVVTVDAEAESGGGRMTARGRATLTPSYEVGSFSVDLAGTNRPVVLSGPALRARADFAVTLAGTPKEAELKGRGNVYYTEVERRVDLAAASGGAKGLVPGFTVPLIDRVRLDLTVVTPEGIRLASEVHRKGITLADLDVRFRGNLRVLGETTAPMLVGNVYTEAGEAKLPFYTLSIVSGDVTFPEANPHNPALRVVTKTAKGDATIFVSVNGTLRAPDVGFFSEPPMPEADIKTFLVTGVRPDAWHGERANETLGVQLASLLVKQVSPYVFGKSGDPTEGFLDRLSFTSEHGERRDATTYRVEFRMLDWLWLVGEKDEWEHFNLKLRGKFGFKMGASRK